MLYGVCTFELNLLGVLKDSGVILDYVSFHDHFVNFHLPAFLGCQRVIDRRLARRENPYLLCALKLPRPHLLLNPTHPLACIFIYSFSCFRDLLVAATPQWLLLGTPILCLFAAGADPQAEGRD